VNSECAGTKEKMKKLLHTFRNNKDKDVPFGKENSAKFYCKPEDDDQSSRGSSKEKSPLSLAGSGISKDVLSPNKALDSLVLSSLSPQVHYIVNLIC